MLETIFLVMFLFALIGSLAAGLFDLKTTEIPDEIPTIMAAVGVFLWFMFSLTYGTPFYLIMSLLVGTVFLAFGWVLYKAGQWGGGDAKLLAAIGYMLPVMPNSEFFSLLFFMNVFLVGAAYVIMYSVILGLLNPKSFGYFVTDIKKTWKTVFIVPVIISACFIVLMLYSGMADFIFLYSIFFLVLFVMIFWRYAKVIEKHVFMHEVPASQLREGDVLLEAKTWDGITKSEAEKLRKTRKKFRIKEGVRFGPVFFLALITTYLLGNTILMFL